MQTIMLDGSMYDSARELHLALKKMLSFAVEGITSLSVKPIRLITSLGLIVFLISLIMLIYFFVLWCMDKTVPGWTTTVVSVWALGGLQLLAIGVIGEYLVVKGRIKSIGSNNLKLYKVPNHSLTNIAILRHDCLA